MIQQFGHCKELTYLLNVNSGYLEKQPTEYPFQKMPFELKREQPQMDYLKGNGAVEVIQGRTVNKKKTFHSGLIPIGIENYYQGDTVEFVKGQKFKSLIIFHFVSFSELKVYFFNRYYIDKRDARLLKCRQFIQSK